MMKSKGHRRFLSRILRSILLAAVIILTSLFIGMLGYHHIENLPWLDAYVNAAMILSGMGPLAPPTTAAGKFFEGTYALFSGIIFLITVGIIFAPVFHRLLRKFEIEEDQVRFPTSSAKEKSNQSSPKEKDNKETEDSLTRSN